MATATGAIRIVERWDNGAELAVEICERMIIDHPQHGRLYLSEARPNVVEPASYIRGVAVQLLPTDTRATLEAQHNEWSTIEQAMVMDCVRDRPLLLWSGYAIEHIAERAHREAR